MATNNEKEKIIKKKEEVDVLKPAAMRPNIDIPVDEPQSTNAIEETETGYKDIDAVCKMFNVAKKEKDDEEEQQRRNEEKKRQLDENRAMAAKKAAAEKARQEEETRKINESRYIRKKMKRKATTMLFCMCIMSAIFGYVVAGLLINAIFNPKVWIFVGVMGIFGMTNTLIHTYLYRYIREEIYRK